MHKVGHRGAPQEFPGNTMQGFERAVELGCTMVECDVRLSKDGHLALAHDDYVVDVQNIRYAIADHSMNFLDSLDLGAHEGVPTLEQLVSWAQGKCAIMADMKCSGGDVEAAVAKALSPLTIDMKIVPGANRYSRQCFREVDPSLPLSFSTDTLDRCCRDEELPSFLANLDTIAVTWHYRLLTPARIAHLKFANLKVFAWTVDDIETMHRLQESGVDGIISNRADLLATL